MVRSLKQYQYWFLVILEELVWLHSLNLQHKHILYDWIQRAYNRTNCGVIKYLIGRYDYNLHQHIFVMAVNCSINYLYVFVLHNYQYISIMCSFLKGYLNEHFTVHMKITILQDDFYPYRGKLDCTVNFHLYLWYCSVGDIFFF